MGCWDVFCFICGNPCHSMFRDSVQFFKDEIEWYKLHKKSKHYQSLKKWYDIYESKRDIIHEINKAIKSTEWMNKNTMLLATNKIIHGCKETSCNINFVDKNGNVYIHDPAGSYKDMNMSYGIFIHTDCWNFINKNYGIKLKFSDIPVFVSKNYLKPVEFINYGKIENYWLQDFKFIEIVIDKNVYICSSPLLEDKNISQIKSNFSKLKIKPDRPSPRSSATFYKSKTYKIGENKNIWFIKNNKWNELKDKIIEDTVVYPIAKLSDYKFIHILKYIGEFNSTPVFVKNINKNKKNIEITFIKSQDLILKK